MLRRAALTCVALCILGATSRADGLDIVAWVVRLPRGSNAFVVLLAIIAILLVDYALNYLVVGWAASKWSSVSRHTIARDLVFLTLLGQIADRAGAILSLILGAMAQSIWGLLVANFVCTGVLIAWLVAWFARKKWSLSGGRVLWLALAAAVVTNPMLPLGLVTWLESR